MIQAAPVAAQARKEASESGQWPNQAYAQQTRPEEIMPIGPTPFNLQFFDSLPVDQQWEAHAAAHTLMKMSESDQLPPEAHAEQTGLVSPDANPATPNARSFDGTSVDDHWEGRDAAHTLDGTSESAHLQGQEASPEQTESDETTPRTPNTPVAAER